MQHDDFESKCSNKIVFLLQIKRNKFNTKTLKISKNAQQKTEHLLLESAEENTFGSKYSNKLESALLERKCFNKTIHIQHKPTKSRNVQGQYILTSQKLKEMTAEKTESREKKKTTRFGLFHL